MSLTVSEADSGASFKPCPAGTWPARCVQLVDLGTQESAFEGQTKRARKVLLGFEICDPEARRDDGAPFTVAKRVTVSLHEKSALRAFVQAWRGRPFEPAELRAFDLRKLLGVPCLLGIVHVVKDGRTFANISSCMRLPKGMPAPAGELALTRFDLSDPDWVTYELLPERIRQQIEQSPEFQQAAAHRPQRVSIPAPAAPAPAAGAAGSGFDDMDNDIPF